MSLRGGLASDCLRGTVVQDVDNIPLVTVYLSIGSCDSCNHQTISSPGFYTAQIGLRAYAVLSGRKQILRVLIHFVSSHDAGSTRLMLSQRLLEGLAWRVFFLPVDRYAHERTNRPYCTEVISPQTSLLPQWQCTRHGTIGDQIWLPSHEAATAITHGSASLQLSHVCSERSTECIDDQ